MFNSIYKKTLKLSFVFLLAFSSSIQASIEVREFSSPDKEETYNELIQELRCLVCQNNNIADSNADLAKDLRLETYELVEKGNDRSQIVQYMTDRYGDFVMYNPPLKMSTYILWFGPFVLLLLILWLVIKQFKTPSQADDANQKSAAKAKDILSK